MKVQSETLLPLSFSLSHCAICDLPLFLEGSRPSCTAGIVLRAFSDTHPFPCPWPSFCLLLIHFLSLPLSHALMLTSSSATVSFHKVPARRALPGTVDAVSHVNSELETDVEPCSKVTSAAIDSKLWDYHCACVKKKTWMDDTLGI